MKILMVLIVFYANETVQVTQIDFFSMTSCQAAAEQLKKNNRYSYTPHVPGISATCIEK